MSDIPLGPELAAAITRGTSALAAFREEDEEYARFPMSPRPHYRSHSLGLAACARVAESATRLAELI
jgi:hypothetical protein